MKNKPVDSIVLLVLFIGLCLLIGLCYYWLQKSIDEKLKDQLWSRVPKGAIHPKYDIVKTDSILYPYKGVITYETKWGSTLEMVYRYRDRDDRWLICEE